MTLQAQGRKRWGWAMAKKKKRDLIYLQFKCKDGSRTVASTASVGLLHWFGHLTPPKPIEHPQGVEIHVSATRTPYPYSPLFLPVVIAGVERTFGKAPEIPEHLHDAAHYAKFPTGISFQDIEKHLAQGTPEIVEYEQICLDILQWLVANGDIVDLALNQPFKPFDW